MEENKDTSKNTKTASVKSLLIHLSIMVTILVAIVLGIFNVWLPSITNHGITITVPDLYETNLEDIEELLTDKGLTYEVQDSVYDGKYEPFTILHQYPAAGSVVKEGRKIFLSINRATPPLLDLPEFTDKSITHYKAIMENLGLKLEKITTEKNPYEIVLDVKINGKSIAEGSKIPAGSSLEIVLGDGFGKNFFKLSNLFGYSLEDAEFYLKGANLNLEPLRLPPGLDTTGLELFVNKQEPLPGDTVFIGSWVKLWVGNEIDSSFYKLLLRREEGIDSLNVQEEIDLDN